MDRGPFSLLSPVSAGTSVRLLAPLYLPLIVIIVWSGRSDEKNQPRSKMATVSRVTTTVTLTVLTNRSALSARTVRNHGGIVISPCSCLMLPSTTDASGGMSFEVIPQG